MTENTESGETDDISTVARIKTQESDEDLIILLDGEPLEFEDEGGNVDGGYVRGRGELGGETAFVTVSFGEGGMRGVEVELADHDESYVLSSDRSKLDSVSAWTTDDDAVDAQVDLVTESKVGSGERPTPDRTVIVEEAHLLRDQISRSKVQLEDAIDKINAAYFRTRVKETERLLEMIEGDGLSESKVREMKDSADQEANEKAEETIGLAKTVARLDTAKQVLEEYFGDSRGPIKLGDLVASGDFDDSGIEIEGTRETAVLTATNEDIAFATANLFLIAAGLPEIQDRDVLRQQGVA